MAESRFDRRLPRTASGVLLCSKCRQPVANPTVVVARRRSLCRACATRRDRVGATALLSASVVVVVCLTALNDSPLGALAFTVAFVVGLWGPIAAHDGGHAIAARLTGHPVTRARIGNGR